ncbi:hypothetical protein ZWY2020_022052 [Hordeum vulgare]|nr:hypothetical protein ZWY2020_022052 [Hordeum vulgare]
MGDAAAASPRAAPAKRRRGDDGAGMRRVAEIVMVLAAAGEMRGGREPTAAERALAAEARERLAAAVAGGATRPKDLFPGEAVRAVVEDLGLNRAKDPAAMGFRPPKASIADRLLLTKRKMEEVKESPVQPTAITPQTSVSSGTAEFQPHGTPMFAVGSHRTPPAAAASPTTAPVTSSSVMALKQRGSSPVKPVTNHSVVALSHTGQPHVKSERGVNGPLNLTRATVGHLSKSFHDTSARSNSNAAASNNQVVKNQDTKVAASQAVTVNPVMGHHATSGTASSGTAKPIFANHNAIAKSVQNVLQQPANHPSWTPPSTEYMQARLDCQICKVAIMDANSLLVCDACERAAHLKCLQHYGNKGVPVGDWHCPTCVAQNKGKPLPPKYGKVTRTVVTSQSGPPVGGTQFSVQRVGENKVAKGNHQALATNGNSIKPNSMKTGSTVHNSPVLALNAATDLSQSQAVSISGPAKGNANNAETSSNDMEWNEQSCSSTGCEFTAGSELSLHSVDSPNDTVHGQQSTVTSRANCPDNSSAIAAVTKIKSEAESEAPGGAVKMVNNNVTPVGQASNIGSEHNMGTQATSGPEPDTENDVDITDTEKSIDEASAVVAEEKAHTEANSEPHTIKDVEMTTSTGIPIGQSSNVAMEEKITSEDNTGTQATSEPQLIEDVEMTSVMDEKSNVGIEEKPQSEPTSVVKDVEMAIHAGIEADHTQLADGSTENGVGEPLHEEACIDKSDCGTKRRQQLDSDVRVASNLLLQMGGMKDAPVVQLAASVISHALFILLDHLFRFISDGQPFSSRCPEPLGAS